MTSSRLPVYIPPYVAPQQGLRRASSQQLNRAQSKRESTVVLNGRNRRVPLVYGEVMVTGLHLFEPRVYGGKLVLAVLWGHGPCEGPQEIYINGQEEPSGGGYSHQYYAGTQEQTPDSVLAAAKPGFADAFKGWAYSRFEIPTGTIDGFPEPIQITSLFRGRKVLDPRTDETEWSNNPALIFYDFATSAKPVGPGKVVSGIDACADRCDEMLDGPEKRCELGLVLERGQRYPAILDLLGAYAELLWAETGGAIQVVPDAPVTGEIPVLSADDIANFRVIPSGASSAPTVLEVTHSVPSESASPWGEGVVPAALPGVETFDLPEIRSSLILLGLQRATESARKALSRLRRLNISANFAWQTFARGIIHERGDVVRLPAGYHGFTDQAVRIMSNDVIAPGARQITAEPYDPAFYPDDVPAAASANVPVDGLLPFLGSTLPEEGWSLFTAADNRYLRGAGDDLARGTTGGSDSITLSGTTTEAGEHGGDASNNAWVLGFPGDPGSGHYEERNYEGIAEHDHEYDATVEHQPAWRRMRFIKCTGEPRPIPAGSAVFATGQLLHTGYEAVTTNVNRLVRSKSDAGSANGGQVSPRNVSVVLSEVEGHVHGALAREGVSSPSFETPPLFPMVPSPPHNHPGTTVSMTVNPARIRVALYLVSPGEDIKPGATIGLDNDDPAPEGWEDTTALIERYIELALPTNAGSTTGDDKVTWSGSSTVDYHNHKDEEGEDSNKTSMTGHHDDDIGHLHALSGQITWLASYYAMRFITYTGAPP